MNQTIFDILLRVSAGDDTAFAELSEQYAPLIRSMAGKYARMSGAADEKQVSEDLSQEATLALYRAAMTYESGGGEVSFGLYSKICIRNALVSELRRMNRKKKADREQKRDAAAAGSIRDPSVDSSAVREILDGDLLSEFEKEVFRLYVSGVKVRDIASRVGRSSKSVSNALYRIKSKLRLSLIGDNE